MTDVICFSSPPFQLINFFLILQIQYEFYFFFQIQDMYAADDLKKGLFSILIYTNFIT